MKIMVLVLIGLWSASAFGEVHEVTLQDADARTAEDLISYNERWFKSSTYEAKRHRIVLIDTSLFTESDVGALVSLKLFADLEPIVLQTTKLETKQKGRWLEWHGEWIGSSRFAIDAADIRQALKSGVSSQVSVFEQMDNATLRRAVVPQSRLIASSWDVDPEGIASDGNFYRHSPLWFVDEYGHAQLLELEDRVSQTVGPPPQTPEDIAHHQRMQELEMNAFWAVWGELILDDQKYSLTSFKRDPAYTLIREIDPERDRIVCSDAPCSLTPAQEQRRAEYMKYMETLIGDGEPKRARGIR
jgi:hypothetical protein